MSIFEEEFNLEDYAKVHREEGREEGRYKTVETIKLYLREKPLREIAKTLNIPLSEVEQIISETYGLVG